MSKIPTIQVGTNAQVKVIEPVLVVVIGPDGQPIAAKATSDGKLKIV